MRDVLKSPSATADQERRRELAQFLRSAREMLDPATAGAPVNPRRRARGWLREEVAFAAGISSTWYMWMEQARPIRISPRALEGLSRALKLDAVKRAYLYRLARPDLDAGPGPEAQPMPSTTLQSMVRRLSPHPAYVLDARWNVVFWNDAADFLFGSFPADTRDTNLIWRLFCDRAWRRLFVDWALVAASAAGQFRSATADLVGDDEHQELVEALSAESQEFAAMWRTRTLAESPSWTKRFDHSQAGRVALDYQNLQPSGVDAGFRLSLYTPATDADAARFVSALMSRPLAAE
ncbi:helix-turn-helix transcriptional regulator [Mesorhizobium sp. IMUNJ 23232]|uniref:helix-turn-helix transcriptional regulator n=1 Tax=Mesorhizobium sp. IMUNJ 23232 TaxID=3376064 RepID=UPI0037929204